MENFRMRRSIRSAKFNAENKTTLKTLTVATIAGLSIIGVGQAQATTLDEVDLSKKPIDTPTLDYLHDNDVLIPQKTFQRDEDGNIVKDANDKPIIQEGTPILAPQSGYSLTKLEANPDGSKPDGDNVITKFEVKEVTRYYDKTTGELVANPISGTEYKVVQEKDIVPQYYNVNPVIPESNNSKVTWTEVTEEGDNTITISSPDGPKYYKYTYNAPSNYDTTTNSNKTKDLGTITNPTGTYLEPGIYKGGAAINNPAGSTITIENYVFQNNKTTAYFDSTTSGKYVILFGGAIYNKGEISKITSDFIGNSVSATKSSDSIKTNTFGGAIYNSGKIGDITGDFIGNSADSSYNSYGGAIYNSGTIGNITGDFISNSAGSEGGAISNDGGTISNITGDFIGNSAASYGGGAIYNRGTIGNITGDFISNSGSSGGAISNSGTIENVTGDFIKNSGSDGGAISNKYNSTIGNITGDFISNEAYSSKGGAIYNYKSTIGDITGDFIGNSAISDGGAIYNDYGTIGNITGDFIGNSGSSGGAIDNGYSSTIGNITGNFIGNTATSRGGAIYNYGKIGNITGDFIGNTAGSDGGAISNSGTIENVTGDFIRNSGSRGGAIYNDNSTIGDITGGFIGNTASSCGGAIYNYKSTIGDITGDFISNTASYHGGAIYNDDYDNTIGDITGNFISNTASYLGGAIYNGGKSRNITGDFIGNTASSGGAIDNSGTIENVTGDFIRNSGSVGGAIYNDDYYSTIRNIAGDFIGNTASSDSHNSYGGAIYNGDNSTIGDITGNFISNRAKALSSYYGMGGAIYNSSAIGDITGDFIGNYAEAENGTAGGGAIANNLAIEIRNSQPEYSNDLGITSSQNPSLLNIKNSSFINNYALGNNAYGGAIYNNVSVIVRGGGGGEVPQSLELADNTITTSDYGITLLDVQNSSFENNKVSGTISALGGAIANEFHISNRNTPQEGSLASETNTGKYNINISNSTFNNNTAYSIEEIAAGGAIYNSNMDLNILGSNFTNNSAVSEQGSALGGAIAAQNPRLGNSSGTIEVHYGIGTFTNSNTGESITLYVTSCYEFDDDLTLQENIDIANSQGITVNFKKEDDFSYNVDQDEWNNYIEHINEQKEKGYASENDITQTVTINNPNTDEIILASDGDIKTITNSSFINNHATSTAGEAKGGAIYSNRDLNIVADGTTSVFKDNYTESKGIKDDNAIYIDNNATLNFTMKNNGKFYMADNIDGTATKDSDGKITDTYNVNIKGDNINNTTFYMLNDIRNANVTFDNTTINAINNQTHVYNFNSLTVNSDTNFVADVDLANEQMDRITANTYGTHNGNLNVVGMNLLSDATKDVTEIYFAQPGLKNNVVNGMPKTGEYNLPSTAQTTFYTPIYKYNAIYDNRNDGGYFIFDRVSAGNNSGNASDNFNPAVLAPSVASQAGANATMNQTFNYAFQNSDNFMTIPYLERVAIKTSNRYALSPTGDATDVGTFSPLFNTMNETSSAWVKPYASFENIPLKNGPKVSNITYGTLVGFDTPIKSIKNGWDRAWTGYIGYNGASQRFSGVDATQNGGLVGGTLTLYKGNFFNATTISSGAIVGDNRTMYGTDNYTMLMAGVGNKTGYNFEFKEGKIIIQPSMLLSYTFVNTFDYTNAAGVKIKNDPLHAIQIAPGVKFIANTKNGWQPYIGVNMIWNLLDKSKVSANDVRLPEMSIKPYVQYGIGVQKRFKDRYMAFGQAMIQNGGRNGISLTAGFRWAIGKEGKPLEKVQRVNNKTISSSSSVGTSINSVGAKSTIAQAQPERKIIKQLSQTQRERIAKQYQNTTRTTSIGEMKKL